jgi:cobaltochelatase CobS
MATIDLDSFVATAMAEYMSGTAPAKAPAPSVPKTTVVEKVEVVADTPTPTEKVIVPKNGFTKMFGEAPSFPDFTVHPFVPDANVSYHIPKEDKGYVVQAEEAARLVCALMDNDKVLMSGPTGSGKSSLIKYVCAKLNAPFVRINMSADVESSALFGQLTVKDGATVWVDGPITEAVRYGCVVLIDEWELMPPEISMGLQNLLEDDGYLFLKEMPGTNEDKTIVPHTNFRLICAGNTVGQGDDSGAFSGTNVQNSATLDRFTTTIKLDYLSKDHEVAIITGKTSVNKTVAGKMVQLAQLVRSAYNQQQINLTMSPRTLINFGNKMARHNNLSLAFHICFYDKLRENDKKVVGELFSKVFGEKV